MARISTTAAIAGLDAIVDEIDAGPAAGVIEIRTGSAPATCETADSGTLLAALTCSDPAFGAASDGTNQATASASSITDDSSADATGTAAHFRIKTSTGTVVMQGDVSTSGADLNFDSTSFVAGGVVAISSLSATLPEAGA